MSGIPTAATRREPEGERLARVSHLPHAMAAMYALAIAYASLQPFGQWIAPVPGTALLDVRALVVPGHALRHRRKRARVRAARPVRRADPAARDPRVPRPSSRCCPGSRCRSRWRPGSGTCPRATRTRPTSSPTLRARSSAASPARSTRRSPLRGVLRRARRRFALPGTTGDVGLALLARVARRADQSGHRAVRADVRPGADPAVRSGRRLRRHRRGADRGRGKRVPAGRASACSLALLARDRRYVGGAVLLPWARRC